MKIGRIKKARRKNYRVTGTKSKLSPSWRKKTPNTDEFPEFDIDQFLRDNPERSGEGSGEND